MRRILTLIFVLFAAIAFADDEISTGIVVAHDCPQMIRDYIESSAEFFAVDPCTEYEVYQGSSALDCSAADLAGGVTLEYCPPLCQAERQVQRIKYELAQRERKHGVIRLLRQIQTECKL